MSIVLKIGDRQVTEAELGTLLAQHRMLPQLAREIIIDEAIADIECTDEEAEEARKRFLTQNQLMTEEQVEGWLKQQGMTAEQLEQFYLREIKLEKFKQETWGDQIQGHFLRHKGKLDRVIYSLIRTRDLGIAQELYFQIQEQESTFAELAKEYSQGAEAQTGGLIGPVELNLPHPQISQMLMSSKPGQLLPPTQVGEWYIILQLEKYVAAELDQPTRQRLMNDLFQNWLMGEFQQTVSFEIDK